MLKRINAPKDVIAGLIFIVFGVATFIEAHHYPMGTALDMGPGYFPAAVALTLAVVGVLGVIRGLASRVPDPLSAHRLTPLILVFAAVLVFSLLIERAGLVVAAAALIGIACLPRLRTRPLEVLLIYLALAGFSAVVFVILLGIPMPLFWEQ